MIDEQTIRRVLSNEANRHAVHADLKASTVAKARLSRAGRIAGGGAAMATIVLVGATASNHLTDDLSSDAAAGGERSGTTVASGAAPGGSTWTLTSGDSPTWSDSSSSDSTNEPTQCFGLSTDLGRSETCHDVPESSGNWLHVQIVPLTDPDENGAAIYGELSKVTERIEIRLRSGELLTPDVIHTTDRPYSYFVSFLDSDAKGTIVTYDRDGTFVNEREFILDRGELEEDAP